MACATGHHGSGNQTLESNARRPASGNLVAKPQTAENTKNSKMDERRSHLAEAPANPPVSGA